MHYECRERGSPAITLPERLDGNAYVLCRDCHSPVATWAVFKRITTQAVLADLGKQQQEAIPSAMTLWTQAFSAPSKGVFEVTQIVSIGSLFRCAACHSPLVEG